MMNKATRVAVLSCIFAGLLSAGCGGSRIYVERKLPGNRAQVEKPSPGRGSQPV